MELAVTPFWSGFTDAYTKGDYIWMEHILKKLELLIITCIPAIVLMYLAADTVILLWVGDDVIVPHSLSIAMSLFVFFQSAYCVYSNLVNGIGKVTLQLFAFVITGILAIPLIVFTTRTLGLWACVLIPILAYAGIAILCRIQIRRIIHQNIRRIRE